MTRWGDHMDPAKRNIYLIAAVAFIAIVVAVYFLFIFQKGPKTVKPQEVSGEVKELSEIDLNKRPFVTLTPTSDGAEILISIENMSSFDRIEYELTYLADNPQIAGEKIQRGSTGTDVNTKEQKYKKSILLGTASKGTRSPDKGVTDGILTMHLFKGENYFVIISDTVGAPANGQFDIANVVFPVYGSFSVAPQFTKSADLLIKFTQDAKSFQLYSYNHTDSKWTKLDSSYDANSKTVSAKVNSFATFVVVSSK
ncbi:MAG: hypothetical protein UU56_C0019G0006 [Candidatus Curtissbacteria bacterium GW2011_GWA2_41_24]|uniref:Uncharacterized protein n=1 Tax=Candidatus Curtissbacteria bacterium GW2011_GWA2_41_24 TaxID=1618411 RepID=A0A0G0YSZ7_9BACT|nr:MAG: hypothetical protein UU56_C0019G0006 [Candidatus Curtissbacteria bacterium GW2011_GWA2_41_24]